MSALLSKIHAVRKLGLAVVKTGEIGKSRITFASYADVWETLKPALDERDLSVGFEDGDVEPHGDGDKASLTMTVGHGSEERATKWRMLLPERIVNGSGSSVTNSGQRTAAAFSFIRRNALLCYFNIATGDADAVERMNPQGDQSNIPGLIRVTDATNWHDLLDGVWRDAESPLHDGKLSGYASQGAGAMAGIWSDYPNHPGLIAWAADWISDALQGLGQQWSDVLALDPSLPATMAACTGPQMRAAAAAANKLRKAGGLSA